MTAEEAMRRWAAAKLGAEPEEIERVEWDVGDESNCPTCGPSLCVSVEVLMVSGTRHLLLSQGTHDLGSLILEVLAAGLPESETQ